ncbi:hypothetical protein F4819DRAFT_437760 [Hypoxylon fuscum]|nr:hypothetical protein F4819DRAFT_437760 [Hypoxylon fuscum]
MTSHHSHVVCAAGTCRPVTVVAATYSVDSQLQNTIISSSSKLRSFCLDLPDEGVFVIFKDRGLQIAAPPCDQRKCNTSHICRCDTSPRSIMQDRFGHRNLKRRAIRWPTWKPCADCLFNWLRLYQATESAHKLSMQFLQHPRTLTLANLDGQQSFCYDSDLEEQPICSNRNGTSARSTNFRPSCSPKHFQWMVEAWHDFTNSGCCKPRSVAVLSDPEDESSSETASVDERDRAGNDSDWDDMDVPCKDPSRSGPSGYDTSDDFDFIDDLVDEEFPKLRKRSATEPSTSLPLNAKPRHAPASVDSSDEEDDTPAPVVVPPKDMAVGRGLRLSTELRSPDLSKPAQSSTSIATPELPSRRPTLGHKRSHSDFAESDTPELLPDEEASRLPKYQKRGPAGPRIRSRRRRGSAVRSGSFSTLYQVPPSLVFAQG